MLLALGQGLMYPRLPHPVAEGDLDFWLSFLFLPNTSVAGIHHHAGLMLRWALTQDSACDRELQARPDPLLPVQTQPSTDYFIRKPMVEDRR